MPREREQRVGRELRVSHVHFVPAEAEDQVTGLLGWVSFDVNGGLHLDGVAVRRTLRREIRLAFPSRRDRSGKRHYAIRPISDAARRDVERQVVEELYRQGWVA